MGKRYDNWQIMIQVPVNFYDTIMSLKTLRVGNLYAAQFKVN
jgi:hypothetical protein